MDFDMWLRVSTLVSTQELKAWLFYLLKVM